MTNKTIDAIDVINQAKVVRGEYLSELLCKALSAAFRAVMRSGTAKTASDRFSCAA